MAKNVKKRNWAFVLYPESAPLDWFDRLQQSGLMGAVSPLHDKDTDNNGEKMSPKKEHYHIILCYSGPTTFSAVKTFTDSLFQPIPQPLESVRGYYRYFTHKDNPDKFQYDERDIRTFGGFNIADYVEMTASERTQIIKEIQQFIRDADIYEYSDLLDVLLDNDMHDMYAVAVSQTLLFRAYLNSRYWKNFKYIHTDDSANK